MLVAVFGPRTRLAVALCDLAQRRRHELLLVARDAAEREWVGREFPSASALPAWESEPMLPQGHERVGILCCAFGHTRPGPSRPTADAGDAVRDLRVLDIALRAYAEHAVHVVFVSSVLSLASRSERAYYAGWKSVLQGAIAAAVAPYPRSSLSVLYPGRLVEARSWLRPASLLYTSYRRLGRLLMDSVETMAPRRSLIGLDARLWLAFRGLGAVGNAMRGGV